MHKQQINQSDHNREAQKNCNGMLVEIGKYKSRIEQALPLLHINLKKDKSAAGRAVCIEKCIPPNFPLISLGEGGICRSLQTKI
jgi:hypothetical protein